MHPLLFNIGPLEVRTYGVLVALSFLTAIFFASMLAKKKGHNPDIIFDLGLIILISAVIGARLLYVIVWWPYFSKHIGEIFMVWEGGLVFYGGLIGAFIASAAWVRYKKLDLMELGDICMPFLALSHAIGRFGCFFNGCCYGVESQKYGMIFPSIGDNIPHLPVMLYESALNLLNFIILILFFRNKSRRDGDVMFLYFVNYGIIRIIMELFRGDPERGFFFGLSTSTLISIGVLLFGVAGMLYLRVKDAGNKRQK
ncbi:MAG: prolipoprotein diacylglyceryl transferase [Spirochaetia bacterium]|nr:prolipoprotein diacylglyceryl transferase [Spirochaetia bacterium]